MAYEGNVCLSTVPNGKYDNLEALNHLSYYNYHTAEYSALFTRRGASVQTRINEDDTAMIYGFPECQYILSHFSSLMHAKEE
jgi:hypothetical protein